jgi:hypothetical protein
VNFRGKQLDTSFAKKLQFETLVLHVSRCEPTPADVTLFLVMKWTELREIGKKALRFDTQEALLHFFPIIGWISRYNLEWFLRDVIAGITMGTLAVPHAMAFARLAGLPTEHGLYTAFCGTLAYAVFSTSKDVTIGMTSVLSILANQLYND